MQADVLTAYNYLVPADQIVIDAMIIALYKKDKEIRKIAKASLEQRRG